jgi:membrane fusion protein (multidrug efflux system)
MLARVSVKVGGRVGLLVPKDAVIRRGTEDFIFVVENGSARRFKIRTGRPVGGMMEIHHKTLKASQNVVVLGNELLKDGAKVNIVKNGRGPQLPKAK